MNGHIVIDMTKDNKIVVDEPGKIFGFGRESDAMTWFRVVLGWVGVEEGWLLLLLLLFLLLAKHVSHWLIDLALRWMLGLVLVNGVGVVLSVIGDHGDGGGW